MLEFKLHPNWYLTIIHELSKLTFQFSKKVEAEETMEHYKSLKVGMEVWDDTRTGALEYFELFTDGVYGRVKWDNVSRSEMINIDELSWCK